MSYVDGVSEAGPTYDPGFSFTSSAGIGGFQSDGGQSRAGFLGLIDEVSVYNRALSASEVASIYNAGSAGKCPPIAQPVCVPAASGLVDWWKGDGNATFAPGLVGQAFSFDGVSDGVVIGNPANLQLQDFTIEAWIKRASSSNTTFGPYHGAAIFAYSTGGYGLTIADDGHLFLTKVWNSNVGSTLTVSDTNWHHVAATKSGSRVIFYVDGVADTPLTYDPGFTFT